jgi:hypothetical protein
MQMPKVYLVIIAVAAVFTMHNCFVVARKEHFNYLSQAEIDAYVRAARSSTLFPSPLDPGSSK